LSDNARFGIYALMWIEPPHFSTCLALGNNVSTRISKYVLIVYATMLTVGSLQRSRPAGIHSNELLHRLLHFAAFGLLGWLAMSAFPGHRALIWAIISCILFGGVLEFLEAWESNIPIEWRDVSDDAIAIVTTAVLRRTR